MKLIDRLYVMYDTLRKFIKLEGYYLVHRIRAKYYIIYREEGAGFFSNYLCVLGHIVLARRLGYIPVVDMKNHPTLYSEDIPVNGIDNAWYYYFQNTDHIALEDVYRSGRYIMCNGQYMAKYSDKYALPPWRYPTEKMIQFYAPFIDRDMRLREDLVVEYNTAWMEQVNKEDVVLGIHIRGTDMKNHLGHPTPAPVQEYLQRTYRMLEQHPEITKIFLATDENNIKEFYEDEFRDSKWTLFMNDAFRVWDHGEVRKIGPHETKVEHPRQFHKYLMGKEVLQDAWFLNKCDYFICGHDNVANVVILWNRNQFRQMECLNAMEDNYDIKN